MTMFEWCVALAAVLGVFWAIGALQRLRRLRAAVADRYLALDEALMRYALCLLSGKASTPIAWPEPLAVVEMARSQFNRAVTRYDAGITDCSSR